jgi:3-methyladenine DNA glycosylase AlkD
MTEAEIIQSELRSLADPEKAKFLPRFFKTGPGEYGEGDQFLGVVVPSIRKVVKAHRGASRRDISKLLSSVYHEERLAALLILVEQRRSGDERIQKSIFDFYLAGTAYINNWDLVDLTAQHIVGAYLAARDRSILKKLALSKMLWERRIAILSTFHFIRQGEGEDALRISELLLHDPHDLIHKAVGWMLREVGNRCSLAEERRFLDKHAAVMPRTMLRYAIERFPPDLKSHYMRAKTSGQWSAVS